ncbi:MAG TPA: GTP 3',8-cyclase MoaA [Acidobacteriota bacterium]|jgi:cyclic pyranopterin phosphate synthase
MLRDAYGRNIQDLRISVTDRCNYSCFYCKTPLDNLLKKRKEELLSYEEIENITRLLVRLGIRKVRLTGGEPLLRASLDQLVARIAAIPEVQDLALTTNGHLLTQQAQRLKDGGLRRLTVSVDSLRPERFARITDSNSLERVLKGIETAQKVGFSNIKINAVIIRGINDDELVNFIQWAKAEGHVMRFIEFMPLDSRHDWGRDKVVTASEMLEKIAPYETLIPIQRDFAAETALKFTYAGGQGQLGIIAPVSRPFCGQCSRLRLTAEGKLRTCLFSLVEYDLAGRLRRGDSEKSLEDFVRQAVHLKEERHHINDPGFVQPARTMVFIGG